ncbi:MAG: carboxypeptidase-like regulatory domain-containing protein [Vicingus serpentipes]|nr:carboxypeptidase-like regulatory domain-containing protein [Vicingus serpentipes]
MKNLSVNINLTLPWLLKATLLGVLVFLLNTNTSAQKVTKIKGTVLDAKTKEPLPFVNVTFQGANIGTTTDFDGNYYLETQWAKEILVASFVGYKTTSSVVQIGKSQTINFLLSNDAIEIEEFVVKADKKRYRNKDNPAVELIKNVIDHKEDNRKEALDFYEYDKYEKIEIDINNITEEFLNKGWLKKKFQVIIDHIDTSEINGKPYLPIFLRETASKMFYRKKPKALKEFRSGTKMTGFEGYLDDEGMSFIIDKLYQDIDIYENNINLLSNQFTSPISNLGTTIYKYFIIDTLMINGHECINLAFTPRNKADFAFKGNLYILNDSLTYAVTKVKMGVADEINLNFVQDLQLDQEYTLYQDSVWMLSKDKLIIDYNLTKKGRGMYGKKTINYSNFVFGEERDDEIYNRVEKIIKENGMENKTDSFWVETRPDTLTKQEEGVYTMIDSIQKIPAFKRTMDIAFLLITGWHDIGKIELGPINTFYSFNDVEGFRLRGGFRTTPAFNKKIMYDNYIAYGFKDKEYKYYVGLTYSFNDNFLSNPQNRIIISHQHETNFPGQDLQFLNDDNFLLSFKRGASNRMLFFDSYKIDYNHESASGFSYNLILENKLQRPIGALEFANGDSIPLYSNNIKTDNISVNFRFAPNEQFYQGKNFRLPLPNKYPIFQLRFTQGLKGIINGEIEYTRVSSNIFKRFYLAQLGFTDIEVEGGKIFGQVPFPLLNLPQANQSFFLQEPSFNMMNFMEFMSDEYITIKATHSFNGAILNKIPLLKRLKWREIIALKMLYGRLTSENDPDFHSDLFRFPVDKDGTPITYKFDSKIPYMEISAGVSNILKIFRVDLLQRVTYLDNVDIGSTFGVKGLGIRAKGKIDF